MYKYFGDDPSMISGQLLFPMQQWRILESVSDSTCRQFRILALDDHDWFCSAKR